MYFILGNEIIATNLLYCSEKEKKRKSELNQKQKKKKNEDNLNKGIQTKNSIFFQ